MKKILLFITTILMLPLMTSSLYAVDFASSYGVSPKGISLGNAMCARVNDWSSAYYNIAGLGKSYGDSEHHSQIGFAYLNNSPDFDIDISRSKTSDGTPLSTDGDKDLGTGTFVIGLAVDIQKIFIELPFVSTLRFGVVAGINDDMTAVKINDLDPRTHNFMKYGRESQKLTIMNGVGAGFMDDSFGIGLGLNSTFGGDGVVLLENVELQAAAQSPVANSKMDMKIEQTLIAGIYYSPGRMFDVVEGLEFGLTYKEESELNINPFQTAAETDLGGIPMNLGLALHDFYQPPEITFGVAYLISKFQISLDIGYQMWSKFSPSTTVMSNFGSEIKELDDIIIPRLGLEVMLPEGFALQTGYYYEPSFVPDDAVTGRINFLDNDKHVGSVGLSYKLPDQFMNIKGQLELNTGCQVQYMDKRDVKKTTPTPENPDYSFGGACYSFIFGATLSL